jgi:hypothetical protein
MQAVRKIIAAGCKQKPFWAVSAMVAAWIGWNERDGHEDATIGDFAILGQQLLAVSTHRACNYTASAAYSLKNRSEETAVCQRHMRASGSR